MKPYIICHMTASVDGRIDCEMTEKIEPGNEYYEALDSLNVPTTLCGKVTAVMHYAESEAFNAPTETPLTKECFWKASDAEGYSVVVDTMGSLTWTSDRLDGKPLICIVSERATVEYLAYLRQMNISYIATGDSSINLKRATEILAESFNVSRIGIVGGGKINGGFLDAGLLDELSLMISPGIDGRSSQPSLFDGRKDDSEPVLLRMKSATVLANGTLWIRYNPAEA